MDTALDRLPPHNYEAEQSVLGSMLLDRDAVIKVAANLRPEHFYSNANSQIYQAILDLYNRREPPDLITVATELDNRGQLDDIGGDGYLASLMNGVFTSVHIEYYADIVEREATRRRLIDAGTKIVGIGYQDELDVKDAVDLAESEIHGVAGEKSTRDFRHMSDVLGDLFDFLLAEDRSESV